jgi:ferredoxin
MIITIGKRLIRKIHFLNILEGTRKVEIDKNKCVGCGNCHIICPMGAISMDVDGKSIVNQDECVECSTCYRALRDEGYPPFFVHFVRLILGFMRLQYQADVDVCPTGALTPPDLEYPRSLRADFSDPTVVHKGTGVGGRGTEEIKTNDVTGRLGKGDSGLVIELGRPCTGAHFRDVEKVAMALAPLSPHFEPFNPVTQLMVDTKTGKMRDEVLDEKILSAIIEIKTNIEMIPEYLQRLEEIQNDIDTVFSVGVASRCNPNGTIPHESWVKEAGYKLSLNGKTNLGLGRPLYQETSYD